MHLEHDETMHTHEHTHADGTTHSHPHHHHDDMTDHEHHTHCDEHTNCDEHCHGCGHGDVSPKEELMALIKYMVGHNASHANELAQLAAKVKELGDDSAYEQIMLAVSDFEKGNLRLSTVLAAMNG